jgi:heme/copper-type cytochrome/quinol oxidase subunit 2
MQYLQDSIRLVRPAVLWAVAAALVAFSLPAWSQSHVIEVLADKDSRYKIAGQNRAEIRVKAGEAVLLRVEARKGKTWDRDGAVHGFTLLRARDRAKVPGWDLELKPGRQEFVLVAPAVPGEYEVVCTVICSDDHEGMRMKFVVVP